MTLFNPFIRVTRLLIYQESLRVFDESFHSGLNVIRGHNSSGKSTIMDFIFYALGGDVHEWKTEASRCSHVYIGVLLNGQEATFRREVSKKSKRPLRICWKDPDAALNAGIEEWAEFPYNRSEYKFSFSQVILRALGFPEVAGEAGSNITIHQIMRLVYSDQLSSIKKIFKTEPWDSPLTRQTVGDLLCGLYDQQLYEHQIRRRDAEKEFQDTQNQIKSIFTVLGGTEDDLNRSSLESRQQELRAEREGVLQNIFELKEVMQSGSTKRAGASDEDQRELVKKLRNLQASISKERDNLYSVELDMADSSRYIEELRTKLRGLQGSAQVHQLVGRIELTACPACFSEIGPSVSPHMCPVCKSEVDEASIREKLQQIQNSVLSQISQSLEIQAEREQEREELAQKVSGLEREWSEIAQKYREAVESVGSSQEKQIEKEQRRVGYIDQEIANLEKRKGLVDRIEALYERKSALTSEISWLDDKIEGAKKAQEDRRARAYTSISDWTKEFLSRDLDRQDSFANAESVFFSFSDDYISVDGEENFSASSQVYLKNSFRLGLFCASMRDGGFRFPRFVMLDNVEDKGMEMVRSQNFQRMIKDTLDNFYQEGQVIFTTSMVADEIEESGYTVGRFFTKQDKALRTR